MAVTAKFQADFSGFLAAIDKAEIALVDMSKGASKVESSLNRMVDGFSGRKLIQEASLMTIAVEKAGGVSTLTAKELETVGAKANEAADKMKRLGIDVPAGMQKLANETKAASGHFEGLKSVVTDVAASLAAMFTVRAVFNFATDVIAQASALKDLGQQTHINVEELQLLAGAMSTFGVDVDTLGKGLFTLSHKVAGGDESVARALHIMGMSLKEVEGLQGQELFLKMEHGLSTLQGSLRDTAAADLFGSKLGAAMAGASEGIDTALGDARRFNTVISGESVDAMVKYDEAIKRAWGNLKALAGNMIGPMAEGFNVLNDAAIQGASKWDIFVAVVKDWATSSTATGANASHLATLLDHVNQSTTAAAAATTAFVGPIQQAAEALTAEGQAAKFMAALQLDALEAIDPVQRGYLERLKEMGALTAQNAAAIGISSTAFAKYTADIDKAAQMLALVRDIEKSYLDNSKKEFDAWSARLTIVTDRVAQAILAESAAHTQLNAALGLDALGHLKLTSAAETLRIGMEALHRTKAEGIAQTNQEQLLLDAYTKSLYDDALAQDKLSQSVAATVPSFEAAAAAAKTLHDQLNSIQLLLVDTDLGAALPTLGGPGQGATRPHLTGQARAGGGPVSSGMAYVVGERGPELFVPRSSGSILPNGGGGGMAVTVNITQPLGTPSAIAAAVREAMVAYQRNRAGL